MLGFFAVGYFHTNHLKAQYRSSIKNETVLFNIIDAVLPLGKLDQYNIAVCTPDSNLFNQFQDQLFRYATVNYVGFKNFDEQVKYSNVVIVALKSEDLTTSFVEQLKQAERNNKRIILAVFGKGDVLALLDDLKSPILWNTDLSDETQKNAAMTIFGGLSAVNKLQKTYSSTFTKGMGEATSQTRIQYCLLKNDAVNIDKLGKKIDSIAEEAIAQKATPGAVVMVVKNGQVILKKVMVTILIVKRYQQRYITFLI
ncbi:hypothetical protein OKW96_02290 [Sphingobacterium sp. KU25419]|nr:hypothetical protein OKW96_02290 [Sphingobacterium sp. KU25419]